MTHTYLESHGVRLDVEVQDPALVPEVERILPPGWRPLSEFPEDGHFTIQASGPATFDVLAEDMPVATGVPADVAVHVLDAQLRARIARLAVNRVFIHAGSVAVDGRALILPAPSFSGKTALVAALVRQGAAYLSDEFAVLDSDGMVHPYAKPLSVRADTERYGDITDIASLGAAAADAAVEPGVIVVTKFVPGARWTPERRQTSAGALALLSNAVPARDRPHEALQAVGRAAQRCVVLEGDRGDATETASELLAALRA